MKKSVDFACLGLSLFAVLASTMAVPSRAWCKGSNNFLWEGLYDNDPQSGDDTLAGFQRYSPAQLNTSTTPKPLGLTTFDEGEGLAFDKNLNLWMMAYDDMTNWTLAKFTSKQLKGLKKKHSPTPAIAITSGNFDFPQGIAFDPNGNLWVADQQANKIYEFSTGQLAQSGDVTPALVDESADLNFPNFITFDNSGDAWVSNNGNNKLLMFTPSQLANSDDPGVIISDDGSNSLDDPGQIEFDSGVNLWVANRTGETVVRFGQSQLGATGNPTPTIELTSSNNSLVGPWTLALVGGNLLVGNYSNGTIAKFLANQITQSGSPTPKVLLTDPAGPNQCAQFIAGPSS